MDGVLVARRRPGRRGRVLVLTRHDERKEVEMAVHPNALRMRRAVEKFMARDMEGFMSNFADDVVWRTGGDNALTGIRRGKDEVVRWFRTWDEKTGGSHLIEPV